MKTKIKTLLITLLVIAMAVAAVLAVQNAQALPTASALGYDYSDCQYPSRTTNQNGNCDNSDPCDPAQTKGGSGDCLPTTETDITSNSTDYQTEVKNSEPIEAAPVASCTGK